MKVIIILIAAILQFSFINNPINKTSVKINPESTLIIEGKTNVNQFYCNYNTSKLNHEIPVKFFIEANQKVVFNNTILKLNNQLFDCGNDIMNKDFRNLLKSKKHPNISIQLLEIEKKSNKKIEAKLNIELAGVSRLFKIPVIVENYESNIRVNGKIEIDILEYNLEPPKKLLGMVKVDNTINVLFNLSLTKG
ncbi:YceI family protein [Neotamlana laminarinivorans]|uniref:YceI family protein n=1 Tax=Neotamlana laminarinivorans TaxID=2883124 RepID=A0A9X1I0D1_9FLAO|nr:YceI family protein [Tamlana laminarinivorans]MCB4797962.1 YceI family protein [Tamlana laminarinivorans]